MGRKKQEEEQEEKVFGDECPILVRKRNGLWRLVPTAQASWGDVPRQSLPAACLSWADSSHAYAGAFSPYSPMSPPPTLGSDPRGTDFLCSLGPMGSGR